MKQGKKLPVISFNIQKRKAWKLGNCLSTKTTPEIVNFDVAGLLGGIIHEDRKPGGKDIPKEDASLGVGIEGNDL